MEPPFRTIILSFIFNLIVVNCANPISSDSLLIKRVLGANSLVDAGAGSPASNDSEIVLRANHDEDDETWLAAIPSNLQDRPQTFVEVNEISQASASSNDGTGTLVGELRSDDHETAGSKNSRFRRAIFAMRTTSTSTSMTTSTTTTPSCSNGNEFVKGKCRKCRTGSRKNKQAANSKRT